MTNARTDSVSHLAFNAVERNGETVYVHKSKPVWIVGYDAHEAHDYVRPAFWQVYQAIEKLKKGRMVWAHDNRALTERGFATLDAAFVAGDAIPEHEHAKN